MPNTVGNGQKESRFERVIIGALLLGDRQLAAQVAALLTPEDFYEPKHEKIYASILSNFSTSIPIDALFVAKDLAAKGELDKVGGAAYLHQCITEVPTVIFAVPYAREVADMAAKRRLLYALTRMGQMVVESELSVTELGDHALRSVRDAITKHAPTCGETVAQMWDNHIDWVVSGDRGNYGLSTGIGALDDEIGGLQPGRLILVAARPGIGKSVIVTQAAALAGRRGHLAQLFSLEMTTREVFGRMLSARCCIDQDRICRGRLTEAEKKTITKIGDQIRGDALVVDARTRTIAGIRAAAEKVAGESKLALVAVDYIQLVLAARRYDSRVSEVGEISAALKTLAVDLNVVVIAAAQLNRGPEQRTDKRPAMSDLRESGNLEQDADQILLLHRPDYYDRATRPGDIDVIIPKNRHGVSGTTVTAAHQLHWSRVVDKHYR